MIMAMIMAIVMAMDFDAVKVIHTLVVMVVAIHADATIIMQTQ